MSNIRIQIKELADHDFSEDALKNSILRFSYLYDDYKIEQENDLIYISGDEKNINKYIKEFIYLVYREKIFQETLSIRNKIYDSL